MMIPTIKYDDTTLQKGLAIDDMKRETQHWQGGLLFHKRGTQLGIARCRPHPNGHWGRPMFSSRRFTADNVQ